MDDRCPRFGARVDAPKAEEESTAALSATTALRGAAWAPKMGNRIHYATLAFIDACTTSCDPPRAHTVIAAAILLQLHAVLTPFRPGTCTVSGWPRLWLNPGSKPGAIT